MVPPSWLRRRRERSERIETEADELARLLGDDAYSEARWREHTSSSSASAQEWNLIALTIARQTGRRIGLDLSTRMAMNAVFAPDREPGERKPRPHSEPAPLDELKSILAGVSRNVYFEFGHERAPLVGEMLGTERLLQFFDLIPRLLNDVAVGSDFQRHALDGGDSLHVQFN